MTEHYGTAPCGCERERDPTFTAICVGHCNELSQAWGRGEYTDPWDCASALEAGLRAIADWSQVSGEFPALCGGEGCEIHQDVDGPGFVIGMELHGPKCPRRSQVTVVCPCCGGGEGAFCGWCTDGAVDTTTLAQMTRVRESMGIKDGPATAVTLPGNSAFRRTVEREMDGAARNALVSDMIWVNGCYLSAEESDRVRAEVDAMPIDKVWECVNAFTEAAESKPATRLRCYHCGFQLNGAPRCPRCDNVQPPGTE